MATLRIPREGEIESFLSMFREQLGESEDAALAHLGISWDDLAGLFATVGEIRTIEDNGASAGFVWIELRERELHIHAIVLRPDARGRGIGRLTFAALRREFQTRADVIELGVQEDNAHALAFYRRLGFRSVDRDTAPGYVILRTPLQSASVE